MKGITLDRLEVLRSLGGGQGVLGAAKGSKSRQGQFSRQLRELERACGMSLVERQGRRLQLNQKGEAVVERYERLLEELGMKEKEQEVGSSLWIGGGEIALVEGIIPLLERSFDEIPVTVRFKNLRSSDAIRLFRRGELDLVLSTMAPKPLRQGEHCRLMLEEGYVIVTSPSSDQSCGLFLKTLLKERLVLLEGLTPIRGFLEREARKRKQRLRLGALCSTYGQVLKLVEKGKFVGVIPAICGRVAVEKGLRVKRLISEQPPPYQVWVIYRKGDYASKPGLATVLDAMGESRPHPE